MTEGSGAEGNVIVDYFSGNKTLVKGIISTLPKSTLSLLMYPTINDCKESDSI